MRTATLCRAPQYWFKITAAATTVLTIAVTVYCKGLYKQQLLRQMWLFSATTAPILILFDVQVFLTFMGNRVSVSNRRLEVAIPPVPVCPDFFYDNTRILGNPVPTSRGSSYIVFFSLKKRSASGHERPLRPSDCSPSFLLQISLLWGANNDPGSRLGPLRVIWDSDIYANSLIKYLDFAMIQSKNQEIQLYPK